MEVLTPEQQEVLKSRHDRLLAATIAVRKAQQAYYAYRPVSDMDIMRKRELLSESKQKERELDRLIKEELNEQVQPGLF